MFDKNLIDLSVMSTEQIDKIIRKAKKIMQSPADYRHACDGKILATLFYEPSTRTQMSFQTAMLKLGGRTIGFDNPMNSSVSKGESLKDTITIVGEYADIIAIRHPVEGTAAAASLYAGVPVINCGDGGHLHPTQTLADIITLSCEKGRLDNLRVGVCGDLLNGRTVHSLIKTLAKYPNNSFVLISTKELSVPLYVIDILEKNGCKYEISHSLADAITDLDVLYMTRIQRERFASEEDYQAQKLQLILMMTRERCISNRLSTVCTAEWHLFFCFCRMMSFLLKTDRLSCRTITATIRNVSHSRSLIFQISATKSSAW